jgi:hypothetical protein
MKKGRGTTGGMMEAGGPLPLRASDDGCRSRNWLINCSASAFDPFRSTHKVSDE